MIEVDGLTKRFGAAEVLRGVDFRLADGATACILGGSGSGKSVLLRLLTGLLSPDAGDIRYDGVSVAGWREADWFALRAQFGVVFQGAALLDSLPVYDNVALRLAEHERPPAHELDARVQAALAAVGLDADVLPKLPAALSGGMKKRVGIARAIVHRPRYLLYDEPTAGLDPPNAARIDELIAQLAAAPGTTSLVVTHDLATVRRLNAPVLLLADGRIGFSGSADAFFSTDAPAAVAFRARPA